MAITKVQPARRIAEVFAADADLPGGVCDSLAVGVAGHVSLMAEDGSTAVLKNVLAKTVLAIRVRQVRATGTTASVISARYGQ